MSGLLSDNDLKNASADAPWKRSETDKMLDAYFAGQSDPHHIAISLKRNPKAVSRRIEQFLYNERDRVFKYEPFRRISRKGARFTKNEKLLIDAHKERDIPPGFTARLLMRDLSELPDVKAGNDMADCELLRIPSIDIFKAIRYAYHIHKTPLISNETFDRIKQEEFEFGSSHAAIEAMGDPRQCDPHIKTLALYLGDRWRMLKREREKKK